MYNKIKKLKCLMKNLQQIMNLEPYSKFEPVFRKVWNSWSEINFNNWNDKYFHPVSMR